MSRLFAPITSLALLASAGSVAAGLSCDLEPEHIQIRHFTTADGLPLDAVYALAQDQYGFLWVGTEDGLARFDGTSVTPVYLDDILDGAPAYAERLLVLANGDLLAGITSSGLLRFDAARPDQARMVHAVDSPILSLGELGDQYFLGARRQGLLAFNSSGDAVTTPDPPRPGQSSISTMAPRDQGGLWLGYEGGGVGWFDQGNVERLTDASLREVQVEVLLEDQDGHLWIGTRQGLLRANTQEPADQQPVRMLEADVYVTALHADADGGLWIGTGNRGLLRLCHGQIQPVGMDSGLGRSIINEITTDHQGSLWVGTGDGLFQLLDAPARAITPDQGLPDFPVLPIVQSAGGAMWLGTFGGGLVRIEGGNVQTINADATLRNQQVLSLAASGERGVWAGTRNGLYRVDEMNGEFVAVNAAPMTEQTVVSLLQESEGLWVGLVEGLLHRQIDADNQYRTRQIAAPGGAFGSAILSLLRDQQGTLWIGTDGGGLFQLEGDTVTATNLNGRLPSRVILDLHQTADGLLWLATNRGLVRVDGDRIDVFGISQGMPEAHIFSILDDQQGYLWMSGNRGVFRIEISEFESVASGQQSQLQAQTFDRTDGMPRTETNGGFQPPAWRSNDGQLWYPTNDGVAVFNPEQVESTLLPPALMIDSVRTEARLKTGTGAVRLQPRPTWVEFHYASPNFIRPQHVSYRYRLEGYDASWYPTSDRSALYRNLGPGNYQFQVQSRQAGGSWSETASRRLVIERHWLENPFLWALIAVMVLIMAAMAAMALARSRRARWEQAAQHQKLEAIGLMAGGIAHDFNNILTRIFAGTEQLSDQLPEHSPARKDAEAILSAAEGGADLTRQLLSFARRQNVEPVLVDLSQRLHLIKSFVGNILPKSVAVSWYIEDNVGHCLIDPVQLQQVVLNLCINSSDAMEARGSIDITLRKTQTRHPWKSRQRSQCALLSVADTGPGMDESTRQRIFEPFFTTKREGQGTGLGLAVSHSIVRAANGWITVESKPGEGTAFHVWLPIKAEHSPADGSAE